jgi:hypothetical protein
LIECLVYPLAYCIGRARKDLNLIDNPPRRSSLSCSLLGAIERVIKPVVSVRYSILGRVLDLIAVSRAEKFNIALSGNRTGASKQHQMSHHQYKDSFEHKATPLRICGFEPIESCNSSRPHEKRELDPLQKNERVARDACIGLSGFQVWKNN